MLVVCHKYIIVIGYLSFILFWASFRSLEFGYQWYTLVFSIGDVFVSDDALLVSLSKSRQNSTLISQKVNSEHYTRKGTSGWLFHMHINSS
jgi:hypothetical protein